MMPSESDAGVWKRMLWLMRKPKGACTTMEQVGAAFPALGGKSRPSAEWQLDRHVAVDRAVGVGAHRPGHDQHAAVAREVRARGVV